MKKTLDFGKIDYRNRGRKDCAVDVATGNFICDDEVVGNVKFRNRKMNEIDKRNNYMW